MVDIFQEETLPTKEELSELKKISIELDQFEQNYE